MALAATRGTNNRRIGCPWASSCVTFTGRTYAVYARNAYILIYLGLIGAACIALDIVHVPGLRCVGSSSNPLENLLLSILMVVFEHSSAILTITRSLMAFKVGRREGHSKGLINLIFEEGVFYFSIISLFTTTAVILNVVGSLDGICSRVQCRREVVFPV
ncbi:hypothetical protein BDN71DRAFT_1498758 [Pleurotus eryngii]|uniref:Uncharacterized protein n=1 Tax=Pleurotus eryngii TaxID=5323 RepID=A0A9P5ZKM3_PLEER|nr:hypothetical protein BDN71DRAFT_1498758 [Pleurotus eryngii]